MESHRRMRDDKGSHGEHGKPKGRKLRGKRRKQDESPQEPNTPPWSRFATDEEYEDYLEARVNKSHNRVLQTVCPWHSHPEQEFPMTPVKIKGDMEWLTQHVTLICNGRFPRELMGMYSEHAHTGLVEGLRKRTMLGLAGKDE